MMVCPVAAAADAARKMCCDEQQTAQAAVGLIQSWQASMEKECQQHQTQRMQALNLMLIGSAAAAAEPLPRSDLQFSMAVLENSAGLMSP